MSGVRWAESTQYRRVVTTTQHVNLKKQGLGGGGSPEGLKQQGQGGPGGLVSYEDLLIAQYLDELRNSQRRKANEEATQSRPSPYTQKLPHSDYTYKYRSSTRHRRPASATYPSPNGKPKIDAKFIADPSLWDPATPRIDDEGPEKYTPIITEKQLMRSRPASAPTKRTKVRPMSAASTISFYGRGRPMSGRSYYGGKRIKSQYKKRQHTYRVTAFRNGTREPFIRLTAPNLKTLLEFTTEKLDLPFAARRVFLEDGVEVFGEKDIPYDAEIYISQGENYKDPYANTKRNIILNNGAKWTLTGVMLPEEGKKKVSKPRLSRRMKKLANHKRQRIIVYRNGKCTEPVEVLADLDRIEEFLVACTSKLDLRSHARVLFDWEGNEITCLADTPILDECLQGGNYVLGPVWVSTGEGFSPSGTRDFLITIREVINSRLKEASTFKRELEYMQEGEEDKVKVAVKILSMSKEELEETMAYTEKDIEQLSGALERINEKLELIQEQVDKEEAEGTNYRMKHIRTLPEAKVHKMMGRPGLKLKVHENGTVNAPRDFYFNIRKASKGATKEQLLQRLLDEMSGCFTNPQNPKLAPIAKKLFDQFGTEITNAYKLQTDNEIWVSFGEAYISPFTYCLQVIFDMARGRDVLGEKTIILREQFTPDDIAVGMTQHDNYEASIGFPTVYNYAPLVDPSEKDHIEAMASMAELDPRGHYLQFMGDTSKVLYPELIMNHKLPKGHKELWPAESQSWVISKSGYIYCKPFPQLCLAVSDLRVSTTITGRETKVEGYVVSLQKRMVGDPHQMWKFNPDATISSKGYQNLLLTFLDKKFGQEEEASAAIEGVKPGTRVYLMVTEPLTKKDKSLQRFALKQEMLRNVGQWKFNDATNMEWNKQALSWPCRADGSLNEDYDWPMEGYILPYAPKLHKTAKEDDGLTGMVPLRLMVVKNGERNLSMACPVVGPNLTNYIKDVSKKSKHDKKNRRQQKQQQQQPEEQIAEGNSDIIELDVNLHCRDLTVRELEFSMFLDHCTSLLNLPFAGRRLFDEHGNEHYSLKTLKRDQLVYVSCGEVWSDPNLSKVEQQRRILLSQLSQDIAKMKQFAALRDPQKYVLQCDVSMSAGSPVIVHQQWDKEEGEVDIDQASVSSNPKPQTSLQTQDQSQQELDESGQRTRWPYHETSHERSEQRLNNLKWPWERLVNVNNSFDADPEAEKYTNRELYEKFKPKTVSRISRDTLQRYTFKDGYIALSSNRELVLGASEPEGRVVEVHVVKRRPDDMYQLWMMKPNGEIRPRHNPHLVLTVSMPNNEPFVETEDGRPLTFIGCKVTLQTRRNNEFGKAHQRWRYDAETGFIHSFYADLHDKEITAANKADVCTYAISNTSKIDQPGYLAKVPVQTQMDRESCRQIRVCMSCARAMRGRYKLTRLPDNTEFSCAMGNAKKLKLQQVGSFRVLNGKVDLSTHEYQLTLQEWEDRMTKLADETTSASSITKEINVAKTVQTVKVLAYKNGEGRLRQGEIICGSSIEGILNQCTLRLGLNTAAVRMYTEDGTLVVEIEDLIDWAIQNYRTLMADHLEQMCQGKQVVEVEERGEGEGQDDPDKETAETDQKEAAKSSQQREFLLSQVTLPPRETILRYPIEIWVSSGKPFVTPEEVESKVENRKKKRAFRSAVSLELDMEKHVLRQMKGRRLDELSPGEYKGTKNTNKPVVVEGHWEEPTAEEQEKHDTVHKLQEHLDEVKRNQKERSAPLALDLSKKLYKQPETKRVQVYPNGESVERATYIWGDTFDQLLDSATQRLNMWQPAKRFFRMDGTEVSRFFDIQKDELLCVSMGKPFKQSQTSRLDIEIKANWSRAHKQYGLAATDVHVEAPANPKVNVDPFGPPELALPLTSGSTSPGPRAIRPGSAKPPTGQQLVFENRSEITIDSRIESAQSYQLTIDK